MVSTLTVARREHLKSVDWLFHVCVDEAELLWRIVALCSVVRPNSGIRVVGSRCEEAVSIVCDATIQIRFRECCRVR